MGIFPGGNMVRVTPTVIAGESTDNDVMFDAIEIPNAVSNRGGVSKLTGVTIIDNAGEQVDMDIIFMQVQTDLGTINEDVGTDSLWTNALAKAAKVLGILKIDWSAKSTDLVNNQVFNQFFE